MFIITGDTHGDFRDLQFMIESDKISLDDTVVILGDAGFNFYGNNHGDKDKKKRMNKYGVTILSIHGNHEMRPSTIPSYEIKEWRDGQIYYEPEFPNLLFAIDGEVYDFDGDKAIVIGGAYSVDKFYRLARNPDDPKWWSDEQPSDEIKQRVANKLNGMDWKVDLVLSHTCPKKYIPTEMFLPGLDQSTVDDSTEQWLDEIENRLDYRKWFCGHWHTDKTVDKMRFVFNDYVW